MLEKIRELAREIRSLEAARSTAAASIRAQSEGEYEGAYEKSLLVSVQEMPINAKVCASDAGILCGQQHGIDLLVCRSVAVLFTYENSRLSTHKYHPSALPPFSFEAGGSLDLHELSLLNSLFRLKEELSVSISAIERFSPDYFLLDGSIAPLVSDKHAEDSPLRAQYSEVISLYKTLYETCTKKNCSLLGVIKDSRGKRFLEILQKRFEEKALQTSSDSSFLHHLLREGERTFSFSYSITPSRHQILRDLDAWAEKISAFYIKPSPLDRPLRCEFLSGKRTFDEIASFIYSLSKINRKYAYPAILIEADMRAALSPDELERVKKDLCVAAGFPPSLMNLRRDERPFR